jgi:hypothetical protein
MILSHRHKFIFFCNGKTGTTSVENALQHLHEGESYTFVAPDLFDKKHIPPTILKTCLPEAMWRSYFKFVFVRDPFDWIVSNWNFHFFRKFENRRKWLEKYGNRDVGPEPVILGRRTLRELAAVEVFSAEDVKFLFMFLARHLRVVPYAAGAYQASFVFGPDGNRLVDFIGRYEQLDRDYLVIQQRLGLKLPLPHLNRTRMRDFRTYFTPESASMAARLWASDFKTLRYPPVLNPE